MGFLNLISFLSLMNPHPPSRRKPFCLEEMAAQKSTSPRPLSLECVWAFWRVFIVFIVLSMLGSHLSFMTILRRWTASTSFILLRFLRISLPKHFRLSILHVPKYLPAWLNSSWRLRVCKVFWSLVYLFVSQTHSNSPSCVLVCKEPSAFWLSFGCFFPAWVIHHFWGKIPIRLWYLLKPV